uniref:Uncharacterized protein n=1 Tax=Timema shepardi TaxID=629360 RepID=A0A7R9AM13_TIMSH|nr:unnamed protein product [Timema shepardi]
MSDIGEQGMELYNHHGVLVKSDHVTKEDDSQCSGALAIVKYGQPQKLWGSGKILSSGSGYGYVIWSGNFLKLSVSTKEAMGLLYIDVRFLMAKSTQGKTSQMTMTEPWERELWEGRESVW